MNVPFGAAKQCPHLVSIQYLIPHILVDQNQVILQFKNRKWTFVGSPAREFICMPRSKRNATVLPGWM